MVHALKEIHGLLKPDGVLIDIHPTPDAPVVEAINGSKRVFSESLLVNYLEGITHAEFALKKSAEIGLFVVGETIEIEFRHYATTPSELRTHWDAIEPYSDTPKEKIITAREDQVFSHLESFFKLAGEGSNVAIAERAYVSRYLPVKE